MAKIDLSKENLYFRAAARWRDLVYFALKDRKLQKKDVAHTRLGGLHQGEVGSVGDLTWLAAGMTVVKKPAEKLVVVSERGDVFTYVGGNNGTEKIAPTPSGIRFCGTIDGVAYACGMNRQVYVRRAERKWTALHAPEPMGDGVLGFEAIAGFDKDDLYAVGWQGEIWRNTKGTWNAQKSPTEAILTGVCCAPDGNVYACGQGGVLVRGRNEKWDRLVQKNLTEDFWDIRWFEGTLFVASMGGLYQLEGEKLVPVKFGKDVPKSCYKLTDADGILWSMGQEDVFSYDGKKWLRWD